MIRLARHKYGARPVDLDGIRFASTKEARRYQDLKLLERAGEVWDLRLQPEYPLHAVGPLSGDWVRVGVYRADFAYTTTAGLVVEDCKGVRTPLYRWKRKHFQAQYGIRILET